MDSLQHPGSGFATGKKFEGHGYRDNKHGFDYQVSQLILVALRALKSGPHNFELASDIRAADKWDDIVYGRPKDDGAGRLITLIQVKHVRNRDKKIDMKDLLSEHHNDHFSLPKYFKSYVYIKKNDPPSDLLTSSDIIEDLIILTNANFTDVELTADMLETKFENLGEYTILSNKAIRFKSEFSGKFELVLSLKRAIIDIPHEFSLCVKNKKHFVCKLKGGDSTETKLRHRYWWSLKSEILNGKNEKFSEKFILDENLSQVAKHFRDELYNRYQEERGEKQQETFKCYLKKQTMKPPTVDNRVKNCAKNIVEADRDTSRESGLDDTVTDIDLDSEVHEFLTKLKFVLNQAECRETVELSMKELSLHYRSKEVDYYSEIIYKLLRYEVNEWMGDKSANYLTADDLKMFLRKHRYLFKDRNMPLQRFGPVVTNDVTHSLMDCRAKGSPTTAEAIASSTLEMMTA